MVYLLIGLTLLFSNELEVEGSLKVTGGIDAQGQLVSNVGNPVLETDATNLATVRSMLGMKPTRIYSKLLSATSSDTWFSYLVPDDKIWIVSLTGGSGFSLSVNSSVSLSKTPGTYPSILRPGMLLSAEINGNSNAILTIYEFPFSSSGTEQGLDFIEP